VAVLDTVLPLTPVTVRVNVYVIFVVEVFSGISTDAIAEPVLQGTGLLLVPSIAGLALILQVASFVTTPVSDTGPPPALDSSLFEVVKLLIAGLGPAKTVTVFNGAVTLPSPFLPVTINLNLYTLFDEEVFFGSLAM
jgi:hypothetical protein